MATKPIRKTATPKKLFQQERRLRGTLVQKEVGGKIKQHFEVEDYKDGKEIITKVLLPTVQK